MTASGNANMLEMCLNRIAMLNDHIAPYILVLTTFAPHADSSQAFLQCTFTSTTFTFKVPLIHSPCLHYTHDAFEAISGQATHPEVEARRNVTILLCFRTGQR